MREIVLEGSGKNALSQELMLRTIAAFKDSPEEAVLLSGKGDVFSAGLHLKEIASLDDPGLAVYLETLDELIVTVFHHPAPVVAHVNGHAIAGGCIIAMCADLRVATSDPKARIGLNEIAIGLEFPPRIMKLIRARVAQSSIDRIVLEAGLYAPLDALRLGLVDEVSSDSAAVARSICEKLASHPPETYRAAKKTLRGNALDLHELEMQSFRDVTFPKWSTRRGLLSQLLAR